MSKKKDDNPIGLILALPGVLIGTLALTLWWSERERKKRGGL